MAVTTASISLAFQANDPATFGLAQNINVGVNAPVNLTFTNGSGANAFNLLYSGARTLSGTTDVLNLTSGLTDPDGVAIVAARIKGCMVLNTGANPITLGAGTDPIVNFLAGMVPPGGFAAIGSPDSAGWVVTASTAMNYTITGTSGQTYEIVLFVSNS